MRRTDEPSKPRPRETSEPTAFNPAPHAPISGLYLVGTPLGNLGDMTVRGRATLAAAALVAAEDTRVARRLYSALGLSAPKMTRFDANSGAASAAYLAQQARDRVVVYVSDAGMPGIADPGAELVAAAREVGAPVTVVPGPSAIATAIALSGLPAEPFLFLGFLPPKTGPRARRLAEFRDLAASLVVFEAPHRLAETLAAMAEILGERPAAVARELTKRFEECRRGSLAELAAHYRTHEALGEIVLVVGPPAAVSSADDDAETIEAKLKTALATLGVRDAADRVAAQTGLPRRAIYAKALELAGKGRK